MNNKVTTPQQLMEESPIRSVLDAVERLRSSQNAYVSVQEIAEDVASTEEVVVHDATELCGCTPPMLEGDPEQGYWITPNGHQQVIDLRNHHRV